MAAGSSADMTSLLATALQNPSAFVALDGTLAPFIDGPPPHARGVDAARLSSRGVPWQGNGRRPASSPSPPLQQPTLLEQEVAKLNRQIAGAGGRRGAGGTRRLSGFPYIRGRMTLARRGQRSGAAPQVGALGTLPLRRPLPDPPGGEEAVEAAPGGSGEAAVRQPLNQNVKQPRQRRNPCGSAEVCHPCGSLALGQERRHGPTWQWPGRQRPSVRRPCHSQCQTTPSLSPILLFPKLAYAEDAKDALAACGLKQILPGRPVDDWKVAENEGAFRPVAIVGARVRDAHDLTAAAFQRDQFVEEVCIILLVREPQGTESTGHALLGSCPAPWKAW